MDELNRILIAALKGEFAMKEPTMQEVLELVEFGRDTEGNLLVTDVMGSVIGDVRGNVYGKINGRKWQFVETPKERAIRLIREGKGEEAIKVLEGE